MRTDSNVEGHDAVPGQAAYMRLVGRVLGAEIDRRVRPVNDPR
jgi:hypothetical protein